MPPQVPSHSHRLVNALRKHIVTAYWAIDQQTTWDRLAKFRGAFLPKALTSFSLAAFGLANLTAPLESLGADLWSLRWLFVGSALFLAGYVVLTARTPSEFTEKSDILEIVDRMSQVQDESSVKARRSMTHSLLEGFDSDRQDHGGTTTGRGRAILSAKEKALDKADAAVDWKESSKSIYAADLGLRKYYRPRERFGIAALLAGGLVFLLIPTLLSVIRAISHF